MRKKVLCAILTAAVLFNLLFFCSPAVFAEEELNCPVPDVQDVQLSEVAETPSVTEMPITEPEPSEEQYLPVEEEPVEEIPDEEQVYEEIINQTANLNYEEVSTDPLFLTVPSEPEVVPFSDFAPESWETEVEEGLSHGYDASWGMQDSENAVNDEIALFGITDPDFPILEEFILVEDGATVTAGDTVHFKLKLFDQNGIGSAYIYFGTSSSRSSYIRLQENSETGYFEGSYTFSENDAAGEYSVWSGHFNDRYGFYSDYSSNSLRVMQRHFPGMVFVGGDSGEVTPVINDMITDFILTENGQILSPGETVHVSFKLPAGFDVSSIYCTFNNQTTSKSLYLSYYSWSTSNNTLLYDSASGTVSGELLLTSDMSNGKYIVSSVSVSGKNGERSSASFSNYGFTLTGAKESLISISDISCDADGKTLTDGDTVHISFRATSNETIESAGVYLALFNAYDYSYGSSVSHHKSSNSIDAMLDAGTGLYHAELQLGDENVYGVYAVSLSVQTESQYVYQDTDYLFSFSENPAASFERCAPATNLHWTADAYACFTLPADHHGRFDVSVYSVTSSGTVLRTTYSGGSGNTSWTQTSGSDIFIRSYRGDLTTGDYFFTVTVLGDGVSTFDSVSAKSDIFHYTVPEKKLGFATGLSWVASEEDSAVKIGMFSMPSDKTYLSGYEYDWYYSRTENTSVVSCGITSTGGTYDNSWDKITGTAKIPDVTLQKFGVGYYYYRVRLLSNNILECRNGEWGELSPAYYVGQIAENVQTKLREVVTEGKTGDEIREQVQEIPTEELKQAMLSDETVVSRIRQLEAAAESNTVVWVSDEIPMVSSDVKAVGAGLNNTLRAGDVTLLIDRPEKNDVLPGMYDNSVAVRFSMDLDNVVDTSNLAVPVLIDIPVPANINPAFLVLLHYPASGEEPETLSPVIYSVGDRYYAQFVLTSFSDYILTQKLSPLFPDVSDSSRYFYESVYWALQNNITKGYGQDSSGRDLFSPDAPCTREQIVTFLWRLMKEPEPLNYDRSFTDVSPDKWYYKPIMWAASTGITTGYADGSGRFGIGDPCTREQCVTFLWRAAGMPAVGAHSDFTDVTSDRYYYDSISWAAGKNITVGLNDGTGRFGVGQTCSRAMIVTFLYRYANGG